MNNTATRSLRLPRAFALGTAIAAGAVGLTGVGSIPAANATCASFFGIGNSANCTSTLTTIAVALGPNAQAHAGGVLGAAISIGDTTSATTAGLLNIAFTHGAHSTTYAGGTLAAALAVDAHDATVSAGTGPWSNNNWFNVAALVGARTNEASDITVNGIGNLGVGFLSSGDIDADGTGTVTVNALGPLNNLVNHGNLSNVSAFLAQETTVASTGTVSWAWDVIGVTDSVEANGGFSVAGALAQENQTVIQNGPGVNLKLRPTAGSARTKAKPAASRAAGADATASDAGSGTSGHGAKARNRG